MKYVRSTYNTREIGVYTEDVGRREFAIPQVYAPNEPQGQMVLYEPPNRPSEYAERRLGIPRVPMVHIRMPELMQIPESIRQQLMEREILLPPIESSRGMIDIYSPQSTKYKMSVYSPQKREMEEQSAVMEMITPGAQGHEKEIVERFIMPSEYAVTHLGHTIYVKPGMKWPQFMSLVTRAFNLKKVDDKYAVSNLWKNYKYSEDSARSEMEDYMNRKMKRE